MLVGMDLAALTRPDRYPLSTRYDPAWVLRLDMGPHPLWQLEDLLDDIDLHPGAKVLDLGCGKGATSVFLARECGVDVVAFDLWIDESRAAHEPRIDWRLGPGHRSQRRRASAALPR